ncbi:MAG: CPBP family glutamic-type intramembrane protease [Thermoguttaceae bacterium]|nr:CPBP family glutamic-type intramembrane protease [Thermoguttaceae bacterium]MDW8036847.1 CPBP family glutamic-type intramembrane protease [Thermoguttaceae bacterium]
MNSVEESNAAICPGAGLQEGFYGGWGAFLCRHRWVGFVLPFVVYMAVGVFEPIRPPPKPKPHPLQEPFPEQDDGLSVETTGQTGDPASGHAATDGSLRQTDLSTSSSTGKAQTLPQAMEPFLTAPAVQLRSSESGSSQLKPTNLADQNQAAAPSVSSCQPAPLPEANWAGIPYAAYPLVYTLKILLTCVAVGLVWPVYRQFPWRVSLGAVGVGIGGLIIWLGFGALNLERKWLEPIGLGALIDLGARSGFDPFRVFHQQPVWLLWAFVALRLFGMIGVVALVEEFFLRGFLMRYVLQADWWQAPIGSLRPAALVACVLYAVLSHPAELFGASIWFLFVSLLAYKTKNIWDCVVAHATTNLLLGAYILLLAEWQYW